MDKKFIVVASDCRYVSPAPDKKTCLQKATQNCSKRGAHVVKITELTEELQLTYDLVATGVRFWDLKDRFEEVTGEELGNFDDGLNGWLHGGAIEITDVEKLRRVRDSIIENGRG